MQNINSRDGYYGYIEKVNKDYILEGWCARVDPDGQLPIVDIYIDDLFAGKTYANLNRRDLLALNPVDKAYGFAFSIPKKFRQRNFNNIDVVINGHHLPKTDIYSIDVEEPDYTGYVDIIDEVCVCGWVSSSIEKNKVHKFDISINDGDNIVISADLERIDTNGGRGFLHVHPTNFFEPYSFTIKPHGHEIPILGTPKIFIPAYYSNYLMGEMVCGKAITEILPPYISKFITSDDVKKIMTNEASPTVLEKGGFHPKQTNTLFKEIDVIIPVYAGYDATKKCIDSVIEFNTVGYNIIVIDDCSYDQEIINYLSTLRATGKIVLYSNFENKGFVYSVNRGISINTKHDIILLNSDTCVYDDWAKKLQSVAYAEGNIGLVCPFSNNGYLTSYPRIFKSSSSFSDISFRELNALASVVNKDLYLELPTISGFCMFLKRDMVNTVGLFDYSTYSRGYGEENDYALRALKHGWKSCLDMSTFVYHEGSVSFANEAASLKENNGPLLNSKYPEYNLMVQCFLKKDPIRRYRNKISLQRLKNISPLLLFMTHRRGGGTSTHINDLADLSKKSNITVLCISCDVRYIYLDSEELDFHMQYDIINEKDEFISSICQLNFVGLHVHHFLDFNIDLVRSLITTLRMEYLFTVHDYMTVCPRIHMNTPSSTYCCSESNCDLCDLCIETNKTFPGLELLYAEFENTTNWRNNFRNLLIGAKQVLCPSKDTQLRLNEQLNLPNTVYKPHPGSVHHFHKEFPDTQVAYNLLILGAINEAKGLSIIKKYISYAEDRALPFRFHFIGFTTDDEFLKQFSNTSLHGTYKSENINSLLSAYCFDFSLFFSTIPETFSYTLSEALRNNIVPIGVDIGAISERIKDLGLGFTIKPSTPADKFFFSLQNFINANSLIDRSINIGSHYDNIIDYYNN